MSIKSTSSSVVPQREEEFEGHKLPADIVWRAFTQNPSEFLSDARRLLHGITLWTLILLCPLVHLPFIAFFLPPLMLLDMKLARATSIHFLMYVMNCEAFILEYVGGVSFELTLSPAVYLMISELTEDNSLQNATNVNDANSHTKEEIAQTVVLVSNHWSRVDWMFHWILFARLRIQQFTVVVTKASVKWLPIVGWFHQWFGLFVARNWATDKVDIRSMVRTLRRTSKCLVFSLFPEGTDRYFAAVRKSHEYALKCNLPFYDYVIHPKTNGFFALISALLSKVNAKNDSDANSEVGNSDANDTCTDSLNSHSDDDQNEECQWRGFPHCILDATIAYVPFDGNLQSEERINEVLLLQGRLPRKVLVHVECYALESLIGQFREHQTDRRRHQRTEELRRKAQMLRADSKEKEEIKDVSESEDNNNTVSGHTVESQYFYPLTSVDEVCALAEWRRDAVVNRVLTTVCKSELKQVLDEFLAKTWLLKEGRLQHFYETGGWMQDCEESTLVRINKSPTSVYATAFACECLVCLLFGYTWLNHAWFVYCGLSLQFLFAATGMVRILQS